MSEKNIEEVYADRNALVEAFARALYDQGQRVCYYIHDEWAVINIELPNGQVSWHVRPDPENIPDWMPERDGTDVFDGHDNERKIERLKKYARRQP